MDIIVPACTYADQAAADLAFANWKNTASVSGGCAPTSTPGTGSAPAYCGGSTTVTWTIADKCYAGSMYSATFTIQSPAQVVVTQAMDIIVPACTYADQAAADLAFANWKNTASVSGGCAPTSTPGTGSAPAYCGGSTTVTWTIADKCYAGSLYSATFTIQSPAQVVVTQAMDIIEPACTYADQAAADLAFANWKNTASVSGGCAPTSTPGTGSAPAYCGGSTTVTWTIADKCYAGSTYSATFTIQSPAQVVVTQAIDKIVPACTYADQAAADLAFANWKNTASVSGGCAPTSTPGTGSAPAYCGGSTTVTWTIADKCYAGSTYSATFTIQSPAQVVVTQAIDKIVPACTYADQAAADLAFANWKNTASVSGGCAPTSTPGTGSAPAYCGGSTTVTWTIADKCYAGSTYSATFTIQSPAQVVVTQAIDKIVPACTYADQAAADLAFANWKNTASVSGGCAPTSTPGTGSAPAYCGGSTTVTWTIADKCYAGSTYSATFTILAPPALVVNPPADFLAPAATYPNQAAADAAFALWLNGFSVTGGCHHHLIMEMKLHHITVVVALK